MTDRKQQPAALRRRVEVLEQLLIAEKERGRKLFFSVSDLIAENVDLRMRLEAVLRAAQGGEP